MKPPLRQLVFLALMAATGSVLAAEPDAKALLGNLQSAKVAARREAAKGLAELGTKAKEAVPELTQALNDKDAQVRFFAVAALGEIGTDAKSAAKAMAEKFDDPVFEVRRITIDAFPRLGPDAVPVLIDAIKNESYRVRINAAMAAKAFGMDLAPAVDALIGSLDDEVWMVRQNAAGSLAVAGPKAKAAIPKLVKLAHTDDNVHVRHNAVDTLFELGADADDLMPLAMAAMKDPGAYPKTRYVATGKIERLGEKARPALPLLIELLKSDEEPMIRMEAAHNLAKIGGKPEEILDPLTKALDDRDPDVQAGAAYAIGKLGPKAAPAVPAIRKRLAALGNGPKPKLEHWGQECRVNLLDTLGAIGKESLAAIPEITTQLDNPQPEIRAAAARLLGSFGKDAADAAPAIKKLAQDQEQIVRDEAAGALKKIGTE